MTVDRRDFVGGAAAIVAGSGCLFVAAPARARQRCSAARGGGDEVEQRPAPELEEDFRGLVAWASSVGWAEMLRAECGLRLDAGDLDAELFRRLPTEAFPGFGGARAIEPGDPAMSLLYHVLASPGLRLPRAGGHDPARVYPETERIDLLENYIYARAPLPATDAGDVLAMFAYQYRPAHKTPHCRHSDLVFSRTGVARTGNAGPRYDPTLRSHDNVPAGGAANEVAVTPARYALFWARSVDCDIQVLTRMRGDSRRRFLLPIRKVYSGCPTIGGAALRFLESHRDEKLARLMAAGMSPAAELGFDFCKPPFLRHSRSAVGPDGGGTLPKHDSNLVRLERTGSSVLLFPVSAPLVEPACQNDRRVRFRVPPATGGIRGNRRYTSLKLERNPLGQILDFFHSDILFGRGPRHTVYGAPKTMPAFVNIRYRMSATGDEAPTHLGPTEPDLVRCTNREGVAALFVDGLCDGCVTADFVGPAVGDPERAAERVLPAFSLVAAPDFFPRVDPLDVDDFNDMFMEGGPEDAGGARQLANPHIPHPTAPRRAFVPSRPGIEGAVEDTITAVVSAAAAERRVAPDAIRASGINILPDTTSRVFAPGWDMTYSRDGDGPIYFATFGLGSPFPEDMKLCAAANGMWPGVSPDAARTFYPSLKPLPSLGGNVRPQTAIPMLDDELGYHPMSPAHRDYAVPCGYGWDGEHGPFFEVLDAGGRRRLYVNYVDVGRADYVENACAGRIDFSRVRRLSSEELIARMRALRRCLDALPGNLASRFSSFWLVSAQPVADWRDGAPGFGIPRRLFGDPGWAATIPAEAGASGPGWLYLFARIKIERSAAGLPRERVPCRAMYVCQVVGSRLRWCRVSGSAPRPPAARSWTWSG